MDVKLDIGNDAKSNRGGNGVGIFYLDDRNDEDIGGGIFGMTKRFNGFAIFINNVLTQSDDIGYIQGFVNDGEELINPMKIDPEASCSTVTRNRENGTPLHLRIIHDKTTVKVQYLQYNSENWSTCYEIEEELHFAGSWLVTAGAAINSPDHVYLKELSLHDGGDPVYNQESNQKLHREHEQ